MAEDLSSKIQPLLDRLVNSGAELGLQVAVYHRGQLRISAEAGLANRSTRAKVTSKTLFPSFSVTKGIAATVTHRLVERGLLNYDITLASVWPEFAAHGKEDITLREALFHASGLPQMPDDISIEDMGNWELMCAKIAELKPLWSPGSRIDYHPVTYGWLIGEVACRVTGKTFPQLVEEEIRQPLATDDLFIGIPAENPRERAVLEDDLNFIPIPTVPPPGTPETVPARFGSLAGLMNRRDAQASCVPATSGLFTAKGLALHYQALLDHSLLSAKQFRIASQVQVPSRPEGEYPQDRALGYHLGFSPTGSVTVGHGGHGGSNAFADPDNEITLAITKNRLNSAETANQIIQEIYRLAEIS